MASRLWRLLPAFFLLFGPVAPAFGAAQPAAKKAPDPRAWPVAYEATTTPLQEVLDGAKKPTIHPLRTRGRSASRTPCARVGSTAPSVTCGAATTIASTRPSDRSSRLT